MFQLRVRKISEPRFKSTSNSFIDSLFLQNKVQEIVSAKEDLFEDKAAGNSFEEQCFEEWNFMKFCDFAEHFMDDDISGDLYMAIFNSSDN